MNKIIIALFVNLIMMASSAFGEEEDCTMCRKSGFKMLALSFLSIIPLLLGAATTGYAGVLEPGPPPVPMTIEGPKIKGKLVLTRDAFVFVGECKVKSNDGDSSSDDPGNVKKRSTTVAISAPLYGTGYPEYEGIGPYPLEHLQLERGVLSPAWDECQTEHPNWTHIIVTKVKKLQKIDSDGVPGADILTARLRVEYIVPVTP